MTGWAAAFPCWLIVLLAAQSQSVGSSDRSIECGPRFAQPARGLNATSLNGVAVKDACFLDAGAHHVFIISDWGGVWGHTPGAAPRPAHDRKRAWGNAIDNDPQQRVAEQMRERAVTRNPDYILNAGDNFYWAGIDATCGLPDAWTGQWGAVFEAMYRGPGLDGKQWLGVLGNHDYGGWKFESAWDQIIGYTWINQDLSGRWFIPAQFWSARVHYAEFSVDYFFLDSNFFDVFEPRVDPHHNICSLLHNGDHANCSSVGGPESVWDCPHWFKALWETQKQWLPERLAASTNDWQIIVTHFPPTFAAAWWREIASRYGVDLIISGHIHAQEIYGPRAPNNFLAPTTWVISGGGGGIFTESEPDMLGNDDQYGFMDLTMEKEMITLEAISHSGALRSTTEVLKVSQLSPSVSGVTSKDAHRIATNFTTTTDRSRSIPTPRSSMNSTRSVKLAAANSTSNSIIPLTSLSNGTIAPLLLASGTSETAGLPIRMSHALPIFILCVIVAVLASTSFMMSVCWFRRRSWDSQSGRRRNLGIISRLLTPRSTWANWRSEPHATSRSGLYVHFSPCPSEEMET